MADRVRARANQRDLRQKKRKLTQPNPIQGTRTDEVLDRISFVLFFFTKFYRVVWSLSECFVILSDLRGLPSFFLPGFTKLDWVVSINEIDEGFFWK